MIRFTLAEANPIMAITKSLIAELDTALAKGPGSRRLAILGHMIDLFLLGAGTYSNEQIAIFDQVIFRLIRDLDQATLATLSVKLTRISQAPENVVAYLSSSDDIAIAGPTLEKCEVLSDVHLVDVATKKSQKHLAAIAGRLKISELVTDVLVNRGSDEVLHKLTRNQRANISEIGFVKLIKIAKSNQTLAAAIAVRRDLPQELRPFLNILPVLNPVPKMPG